MIESNIKGFDSTNNEQADTLKKLKPYVAPKSTLIEELEIESGGQVLPESNNGNLS